MAQMNQNVKPAKSENGPFLRALGSTRVLIMGFVFLIGVFLVVAVSNAGHFG
jgi:hypothetical protein